MRHIARDLGVEHILEGSIRKIGNRLRVNLKLIDAKSGTNRWATRYDRQLSDIFSFQDDVTRRVAGALSETFVH